ncbi:MAG: hypothetical protein AAFN59_07025 [Pseudomonadota bacterium]
MIILGFFAVGLGLGLRAARRQGGQRLDQLQYGAIYGLIGALVGLFVTVILDVNF